LFSRANLTANVDGADTEAIIAIPAASAFCTISNQARPLTSITSRSKGSEPSRKARPIVLSTALWRPMFFAARGCGVLPRIDRRAEPLAAIYPREALIDLQGALASSDFSLQTWTEQLVESGNWE